MYSYLLAGSQESTTSDYISDTKNEGVRWLFSRLAELIAEKIECEKGKSEDERRK